MNKLVISKNTLPLSGYTVVSQLAESMEQGVDVFILNSSDEDDVHLIPKLAKFNCESTKFFYISSEPNPLLVSVFNGLGGVVTKNTSYLENEDMLNRLVDRYRENALAICDSQKDFSSLVDSVKELINLDASKAMIVLQSSLWQDSVMKLLNKIKGNVAMSQESDKALVSFAKGVYDCILDIKSANKDELVEVKKLKQMLDNLGETSLTYKNDIYSYPTIRVDNVPQPILFVKVLGNCRFLNSFLIAYIDHVREHYNKAARILFVMPNLIQLVKKYSGTFQVISSDALELIDTQKQCYVTFDPRKSVITKFFSLATDVHIVVDYTYQEDIITAGSIIKYRALGGISDIRRLRNTDLKGVKKEQLIFCMTGVEKSIIIPEIVGYSDIGNKVTAKTCAYCSNCLDDYKLISSELGLRRD